MSAPNHPSSDALQHTSKLPLAGINVLDLGQYIAGPAVAMVLGDLGATVVRIEHPDGPRWDSPSNAVLNRNKLIVPLDLKSGQGLDDARTLAMEADVVVENFRPGVLSRLGLDLAELRRAKPGLITLSIPGFASDDELRSQWKAFESIVAAASGVFTDMGLNRVLMGVNPSFSPLPLASAYATSIAAASVALALYGRAQTGRGDHIEVPLASAAMEGLTYNSIHVEDYPDRYKTQRELEILRRRELGLAMDVTYDELQELLDPFYRSYRCSDGRMFYVVCPSHRYHAKRCLQALGLYDEMVVLGLKEEDDVYLPKSEWSSTASLGSYPLPKDWADTIAARMKEVFLTKTSDEWNRIFGEGQFPGTSQNWLSEWIDDPHVREAALVVEVDDPVLGPMIQPGPIAWLTESATDMLHPTPRMWGSITDAKDRFARTLRQEPREAAAPAGAPWLQGVRVLDLCNVIAGPHSGAFLSRFGAEVIKIDPAQPLFDPWNHVVFGLTHMRGKKSALVDLRSPEGKTILEDLVRSVDVVIWNATDRQVRQMGLNAESLHAINPRAVFCQLDCFSGVLAGPRTNYLGYDDLVQAATGIMLRFGGSMETPEEHAHVGTIDVMCGFAAALGIACALYQRETTGHVDRARTSLSALTGLAQLPFFFTYSDRGAFDEPSGRQAHGYGPQERIYPTASGSIMLAVPDRDLDLLSTVEGLPPLGGLAPEQLETTLSSALLGASAAMWQERFTAAGIGGVACAGIGSLRAEYARDADCTPGTGTRSSYAFSRFPDHPSGHVVTQLDPLGVRLTDGTILAPVPAEKYGTSTRAILTAVGYQPSRIQELLASGVISESWSREYLPS
ncbi:CoA transferase [Microbacterium sp. LWH7-1.2]|uniref:CoA transferase n=2 Tax=Microbacterium sp. LWH7-1.2 TaxID=3135257 RepID=UPI003139E755